MMSSGGLTRLFLVSIVFYLLLVYQGGSLLKVHDLVPRLSGVPDGAPLQLPKTNPSAATSIRQMEERNTHASVQKNDSPKTLPAVRPSSNETILSLSLSTADEAQTRQPEENETRIATPKGDGDESSQNVIPNSDASRPWILAAPVIDTTLPPWIEAYIKVHNEALQAAHQQDKNTDKNKYLVFTCKKSCSGTGNRQRAIFASFMVSMVTGRIFMIDITFPVSLDLILEPHLVRWNWFPPHLDQMSSKLLKLRNVNPPVLENPSKFLAPDWSRVQVLRVEANSPVNMEQLWKKKEVKEYVTGFGDHRRGSLVPGALYKQIFWALYRPSAALTERAVALRKELGVQNGDGSTSKYLVIHARTGGGGSGWKDEDRFTTDKVGNLYGNAKGLHHQLTQVNPNVKVPIIVVSDEAKAKEELKKMDPEIIRYADTKIVHVDRSRRKHNDLDGSLAVWADLLVIAQASCIIKGRGSFSMLGAWLAAKTFGSACIQLVI